MLHAGTSPGPGASTMQPRPGRCTHGAVLQRADGVGGRDLRRMVRRELVPALLALGALTELRSQVSLPWNEDTWDTPDVAHDNPKEHHLHPSLTLGLTDTAQRATVDEVAAPPCPSCSRAGWPPCTLTVCTRP